MGQAQGVGMYNFTASRLKSMSESSSSLRPSGSPIEHSSLLLFVDRALGYCARRHLVLLQPEMVSMYILLLFWTWRAIGLEIGVSMQNKEQKGKGQEPRGGEVGALRFCAFLW